MPVELRPHQVPVVYEKLHNGCILYGDVGVGKTITSLAYYFARVCNGEINEWGSMKTPKDVYVITTAKVRDSKDFETQAAQFGVHTDPSLSTNGVKITVDSWNNLHKYVEVENAFFIFDEQRVVGYGAWARAFIKIAKHNEWILLSATPGDTWLDYIPVFIANGWYKHKTDFLDQHVIWTPRVKYPKVLRYQNTGLLVRRRNQVLVHMPYERHTKRHPVYINCDFDEVAFEKAVKKRWHVYEERPLRDVAELFGVMRKIVNSDKSRLSSVRMLMEKHPKLIVFYNFDYELEALRTLGSEELRSSTRSSTNGKASSNPGSTFKESSTTTTSKPSTSTSPSPNDSAPLMSSSSLPNEKQTVAPSPLTTPSGDSSNLQTSSQYKKDLIDRLEVLSSTDSMSPSMPSTPSEAASSGERLLSERANESEKSSATRSMTKESTSCFDSTTESASQESTRLCQNPSKSSPSSSSPKTSSSGSLKASSTLLSPPSSSVGLSTSSTNSKENDACAKTSLPQTAQHTCEKQSSPSPSSSKTVTTACPEHGTDLSPNLGNLGQNADAPAATFAIAEWNGHKHEEIPATERWLYLVQYRAGAEGWNCIETDAMVFYSQTYSYRDWWQAHGRIDRLNTPFTDLYYYYFTSKSVIDKAIKASLRVKKNFNERDLELPKAA